MTKGIPYRKVRAYLISALEHGFAQIDADENGKVIVRDIPLKVSKDNELLISDYCLPPLTFFRDISDLPPEDIVALHKYQYSLLNAIEILRMSTNGSRGGMDSEVVTAIYDLLKNRFENDWRESKDDYSNYVEKMLVITLIRAEKSGWIQR